MKAGRLSYTVDAAGQRRIDTAELDRVFGMSSGTGQNPVETTGFSQGNGASAASDAHAGQSNTAHAGEHAALERLLADREASIADLRARLDASEAERRQLSERLHGLLTAPAGKATGSGSFPPGEPKLSSENTVSAPPLGSVGATEQPSASSGLAIPRPPWWRRWFR
jgi:hypothetical protein